jgi:hypothetical protein
LRRPAWFFGSTCTSHSTRSSRKLNCRVVVSLWTVHRALTLSALYLNVGYEKLAYWGLLVTVRCDCFVVADIINCSGYLPLPTVSEGVAGR